jgi:Gram-negative bacterial TonB protein C-terminal
LWLLNFLLLLWHVQTVYEPPHMKQIASVEYSPNIIANTWAFGVLDVAADGSVTSATALKGGSALPGAVLSSVSRWKFTPAYTDALVESHVTAVFLFRPRDIFSSPGPDLLGVAIAGLNTPPIPISLSDPGYIATSVAEGEVILELRLSQTGGIENVRAVQGVSDLTEFTERAVRSWRFAPASRNGIPVPGTVIVAVSYLRPGV